MPEHGQPTTFVIGQADPAAHMCAEDAVLFNQMRDARLPWSAPPAGHGHHEQPNGSDIHDRGSLPHTLNDEQKPASAEKWDSDVRARADRFENGSDTGVSPSRTLMRHAVGTIVNAPAQCLEARLRSKRLQQRVRAHINRVVIVAGDQRQAECDLNQMASIGHELWHAIEVLREPSIRSDSAFFFFYLREGLHANRLEYPLGAWETPAADKAWSRRARRTPKG
jgi:hypothetical protein